MAKGSPTSSNLPMFACVFMFMLTFNPHSSVHGEEELDLVLSFKASIEEDPLHFLSNWVIINSSAATIICKWHGITCDNSSHITTINLSDKNLSGEIPASIFQLPYVTSIDLSNNELVGEITFNPPPPPSLSSSLRYLNLSNNNLTGTLPITTSFSHLETLDLTNNFLFGKIPNQIGLLSNLRYLGLGGNRLEGKIPNSIANMTHLQYFTLAGNQLVGEIPKEIGLMRNLKWIYFGYNNLSGQIPTSIGELFSLNHLDLVYNNLTGEIPDSLGNLTQLEYLFLYQNKFDGPIPKSIFDLKGLISLDLSDNSLSGEIPELVMNLQRLEILHLFTNHFSGKIPNALTSLPRLQVLQLWSNKLTGEIPQELGKRNNLTVLDLSSNNLTGKIPNGLCDSGNLYSLILFDNSFEGEIPRSLSSCASLRRVRIQNNKFSGELSHPLTKSNQIYFLDISANQLSGRIDDRKWDMPALQMLNLADNKFSGEIPKSFGSDNLENLNLSGNQFTGHIPPEFRSLKELVVLKLSNNKLVGEIPEELCFSEKLVTLDLSHNQLTGNIPIKLSHMPVLGKLDLSENQLSGEIPQNLGMTESLVEVNISHNHFYGSLPSTGVFFAINASAVSGNNLCDRGSDHTSSGLPLCKRHHSPSWRFVLVSLGIAALAFAALAIIYVHRRKKLEVRLQRVQVESKDGNSWEMQFLDSKAWKGISIDDVLWSAKEGNVICKGRKWVSYEGNNGGMVFMVKEINDPNYSVPLSFWEDRVVEFGKIRHPSILRLIGTCRSGKKGYLVYEYAAQGRQLSELLMSNLKMSWERRRGIAVGIAKALKFLHSHCSSIFVGELSPEMVFVDGKGIPRLNLNPPGSTDVKGFISSSPYAAPEARKGEQVTEKSDIYGFGVILIELLTGRSTCVDAEGRIMHESIVEWARYCYSECHLDTWIDQGGDASTTNQNDIVEMMNLALHCTAVDPLARPCASDVLKALEAAHTNTPTKFSSLSSNFSFVFGI